MKKKLVFITILSVTVLCLMATRNVNSQKDEAVIEALRSNEPLKIFFFSVESRKIRSGEKFFGSDDWIKTLSMDVQNSSGRKVNHLAIGIFFVRPTGAEDTRMFHYSILRGNKKSALNRLESGFDFSPSNSTKKGEKISLSQKEYQEIRESLEQLGYPPKIAKIQVQIEEIVLDDGRLWSLGTWYKLDPNDPEKVIRLNGDKKPNENKTTLSSEFSDEQCYSPWYGDRVCSEEPGRTCTARHYPS